ncbi:hypothetical protein JMUB5695_03020 [Mycobacterium heckeshornense]|uniref:Uncharacterized protein n=1 Tax=Mycobacterium heckeshornense TaxID=110505 RepID=A0A7R7TX51_9MYCO|nr:hypothetical protein MHEC_31150 [Mycobacterium heckeshornense]BCQ09575.1 hypothetical protein JMUB5695_03020 [Mycobacterium heckeshornense]
MTVVVTDSATFAVDGIEDALTIPISGLGISAADLPLC